MRYVFEIRGRVAADDVVFGQLTFPRKLGRKQRPRTVMLVLTEGLNDHKRREKIRLAKTQAFNGEVTLVAGGIASSLQEAFTNAVDDSIKASLQNPQYAGQTLDVVLKETTQSFVILDCQSRECFWAALKEMGTSSRDMFSVAELGAFKPSPKTVKVDKPVGEAHILCRQLARGLGYVGDVPKNDQLIAMIRTATKVKIPVIDIVEQDIAAAYLRDLEISVPRKGIEWFDPDANKFSALWALRLTHSIRKLLGKSAPDVVVLDPSKMSTLANLSERFRARSDGDIIHPDNAEFARKIWGITPTVVLKGDPEQVLRKRYKENYGFDPDTYNFDGQLMQ